MGCKAVADTPQSRGQVPAGGGNTAGSSAAGMASAEDAAVQAAAAQCADPQHSLAGMQPNLAVVAVLQHSQHCRLGAVSQTQEEVLHGIHWTLYPSFLQTSHCQEQSAVRSLTAALTLQ